jgi:hypothetical protein
MKRPSTQLALDFEAAPPEAVVLAPAPPMAVVEAPAPEPDPIDLEHPQAKVAELYKIIDRAYEANRFEHRTFADCCDLWLHALTRFRPGAEEAYLETVARMQPEAVRLAAQGFGVLLSHFVRDGGYADILGPVYMQLASKYSRSGLGQFFTPWPVCMAMAGLTIGDAHRGEDGGPLKVCDPACGSGAMLLACRATIAAKHGRREASRARLYGQDIDGICVAMARIQTLMTDDFYVRDWLCASALERRAADREASHG